MSIVFPLALLDMPVALAQPNEDELTQEQSDESRQHEEGHPSADTGKFGRTGADAGDDVVLATVSVGETVNSELPGGVVERPVAAVVASSPPGGLATWLTVFPAHGRKTAGA